MGLGACPSEFVLAICCSAALSLTAPGAATVTLVVPAAPVPVRAAERIAVVYELHVTNTGSKPIRLERLEVRDAGANGAMPVAAYGRPQLERDTKFIGPRGAPAPKTLGPDVLGVIFVWLDFAPAAVIPESLIHRIVFADGTTAEGARVSVRPPADLTFPAPVEAGDWWIGLGPSNTSEHRRAVIRVGEDPVPHLAQRFGIDWVKMDARGGYARDRRGRRNTDWYSYGQPVLSVADARVAAVMDGIPDNTPGEDSRAVPMKVDTVLGNYALLDLGAGSGTAGAATHRFVLYGHLQPGSLRVRTGDEVRPGQILGLIGNSGNSDGPHLHFHVTEAADAATAPLRGEGVPFLLDTFAVVNHDPERIAQHALLTPLGQRRLALAVEGDVIRIGGS